MVGERTPVPIHALSMSGAISCIQMEAICGFVELTRCARDIEANCILRSAQDKSHIHDEESTGCSNFQGKVQETKQTK